MTDELRQAQESHCENDRDHTSGDQLDWQDTFNAAVIAIAVDALGVVDGDDALCFVDFH